MAVITVPVRECRLTIGLLGAEIPPEHRDSPPYTWVHFQVLEAERRILALEEAVRRLQEVVQP